MIYGKLRLVFARSGPLVYTLGVLIVDINGRVLLSVRILCILTCRLVLRMFG